MQVPQSVVMVQQPAPAAPSVPNRHPRHKHTNTLRGLGIAEAVAGSLCILLSVISMVIARNKVESYFDRLRSGSYNYHYYYGYENIYNTYLNTTYAAQGLWGGIFFLVSGILGKKVEAKPSRCMYIANMTMAIITAIIAAVVLILSGIAASANYFSDSLIALHVIIAILSFAVMIITITHSAFCCGGVCYSETQQATYQVHYHSNQPRAIVQPQYVQGPNGQLMMIVAGPQPTAVSHYPGMSSPYTSAPTQIQSYASQPNSGPTLVPTYPGILNPASAQTSIQLYASQPNSGPTLPPSYPGISNPAPAPTTIQSYASQANSGPTPTQLNQSSQVDAQDIATKTM